MDFTMSHGPYKEYVVEGAELSCSACSINNISNSTTSPISITGGYYIHRVDNKRISIQNKLICTEDDKKITAKALFYCMSTGLVCVPALDKWINPRGRAANITAQGNYVLLDDARISCKKGAGVLTFYNSGQTLKNKPPGMRNVHLSSKVREFGFFVRHPVVGSEIWKYAQGSNNISTIAVLFASNIELDNIGEEGTEVNAFRHTLWQAIITSEYGDKISKEAGNAHEKNPIALQQIESISDGYLVVSTLFKIEEADEIIDLKNNIIGRQIGCDNKALSNTELAVKLLYEFKENGLYVAKKHLDTEYYKINLLKIDERKYNRALYLIDKGLDPKNKGRQNERG